MSKLTMIGAALGAALLFGFAGSASAGVYFFEFW